MSSIGLLGDVHGNFSWANYAVDKFHREGISEVVQLGDLGVWPGKQSRIGWDEVQEHLAALGQTWRVVPGNHEDYDQIERLPLDEEGWMVFRPNILLAPRGHRWEWDGRSFVALGGAGSVDRTYRVQNNMGWWPQEALTWEDVERTAADGYADVMVAHDAPENVPTIEKNIQNNSWIPLNDLTYANEGRRMMTVVFKSVAPRLFFHGHYHFKSISTLPVDRDGELAWSHVVGLGKDDDNFSLGVLHTGDLTFELFDLGEDARLHRWDYNRKRRTV